MATWAGYLVRLGSRLRRGRSAGRGRHAGRMDDATDPDAIRPHALSTAAQPETVPARLARCAGEASRQGHGWTWRGRLPAEAVADLLRSALTSTPMPLEGPLDAPSQVWLRAVWFDAGHGNVACELVAGASVELKPGVVWPTTPEGPGSATASCLLRSVRSSRSVD